MTRNRFKASGRNDAWFAGACLTALAVWAAADRADAQTARTQISANVAVVTDYVFRGVSQTEARGAASAGVELTSGRVYAGVWVSNVAFPGDPDTGAEFDLYAGVRPEFVGWTWDLGVVGYLYDDPSGAEYDYVEAKVAAARAVGPATVGFAAFWSPDVFGATEDQATYVEANAAWTVSDRWTVSGTVGRQFVSSDLDYTTWSLGAAVMLNDALTLDLRYHDTDEHGFGDIYGSRAVASLKAAF